jgi:hypothetical protein
MIRIKDHKQHFSKPFKRSIGTIVWPHAIGIIVRVHGVEMPNLLQLPDQ